MFPSYCGVYSQYPAGVPVVEVEGGGEAPQRPHAPHQHQVGQQQTLDTQLVVIPPQYFYKYLH